MMGRDVKPEETKKPPKKQKNGRKTYEALLKLGRDRLNLVEAMLIKGETPLKVARVIQNEWGQCASNTEAALRQMLYRYKEDNLADKLVMSVSAAERVTQMAYLKDLRDKFRGVEDLIDLANIQKARLNKILMREEQMPVLMDQVSREMTTMANMVERTVRLQLDLGLVRPQDDGHHLDDDELRKVYAHSVQLSAKLKDMTRRALQVIEGNFVEVIDGDNYSKESDVGDVGAVSPYGQGEDDIPTGEGSSQ